MANTKVSSEQIIDGLALGGNPTAATQTAGNNSTRLATTAYTDAAVTALIGGAPSTLDTLNEIAAAVSDDPDYVGTVNAALALKAPKASPVFTGAVTANGGVVVDQLTIDGGNISSSSGGMTISGVDDITLDAVGDVILSCDGDQVKFNDGTSTRFTFNLDSTPTMGMGTLTLFENEIDVGSGNLTLDVAGDIVLDADGGDIQFKDGGTEFGRVFGSSNNFYIQARQSDKDMIFQGIDGGSAITALTLDMSAAGYATFNDGISAKKHFVQAGGEIEFDFNGTGEHFTGGNSPHIFAGQGSATTYLAGTLNFQSRQTQARDINFITGTTPTVALNLAGATGAATFNAGGTFGGAVLAGASVNNFSPNQLVTGENTDGEAGLNIQTSTTGVGYVLFGDGTGSNAYRGQVRYSHANDSMNFHTATQTRLSIDSSGRVTMPYQPAFSVHPATPLQSNLAVGSQVTLAFGTEVFDVGSNFASNTFTAPVTGKYQLNLSLRLENAATAAAYYQVRFSTSNRSYLITFDLGGLSTDPAYWSEAFSVLADMDASDTVSIQIFQSGGTSQTDIHPESSFTGYLVA